MFQTIYKNCVTHVIIKFSDVIRDDKLKLPNNNGRKILANKIYKEKEYHITDINWTPDFNADKKTPILEVGCGGVELATFTHTAKQNKHLHLIGTEIYTVLSGSMCIEINGILYKLEEKDEIVILPGTIHKVLQDEHNEFVTRVHSINCHGDNDKYVEVNGEWVLEKDK